MTRDLSCSYVSPKYSLRSSLGRKSLFVGWFYLWKSLVALRRKRKKVWKLCLTRDLSCSYVSLVCNREFKAYVVLVKKSLRKSLARTGAKVKFGEFELILIFYLRTSIYGSEKSFSGRKYSGMGMSVYPRHPFFSFLQRSY